MMVTKFRQLGIQCLAILLVVGLQACSQESVPPAENNTAETAADNLGGALPAAEVIHTEEVRYKLGEQEFVGYLAYDSAITDPRPVVLVAHEWWGHNAYVRSRAEQLAKLGYVAFALDMYGDGRNTEHPEQAMAFMQASLGDLDQANARFQKALNLVKALPQADAERVAAIGYCFGGATVLNAARAGMDLNLVVSFHGSLGTSQPAQVGAVKAAVMVFHGEADPLVPPEQVVAFKAEMANAGVPLEFKGYPGALHAFTNPGADELKEMFNLPVAYDQAADEDSWQKMLARFSEEFDL